MADTNTQSYLQRQLSNLIERLAHLNEIRLLIAQGAKVNLPITLGKVTIEYSRILNIIISRNYLF